MRHAMFFFTILLLVVLPTTVQSEETKDPLTQNTKCITDDSVYNNLKFKDCKVENCTLTGDSYNCTEDKTRSDRFQGCEHDPSNITSMCICAAGWIGHDCQLQESQYGKVQDN